MPETPENDLPVVPVSGVIRLGQFLKLIGISDSGADARQLLLSGDVAVNGQITSSRGKQLTPGDRVTLCLPTGEVGAIVGGENL